MTLPAKLSSQAARHAPHDHQLRQGGQQRVERTPVAAQEAADERCRGWLAVSHDHGVGIPVGEAGGNAGGAKISPAGHHVGVAMRKYQDIARQELDRIAAEQTGVTVAAGEDVVGKRCSAPGRICGFSSCAAADSTIQGAAASTA